jgi:hypothetical protein
MDAMADSTYEYTGANYTLIVDNTPPAGTNYTTSDSVTGTFVVAVALAPNMPLTDIGGSVLTYSFSDGANTLTESNSSIFGAFDIATDALGNISEWQLTLQSGPPLPAVGVPGEQREIISSANLVSFKADRGILQECTGPGPGCGPVSSDLGQVFNSPGPWMLLKTPGVISFGVQGGQPGTESIEGLVVRPADAVDVAVPSISFDQLASSEDIDAYHEGPQGTVIFSTSTGIQLGEEFFQAADLIRWKGGTAYSLYFDGAGLLGPGQNIDAVTLLPQNRMLISTAIPATLYGFSFNDGDVVLVDRGAETAVLFEGLDEAALFTGSNQNIDALHYDVETGALLLSVLIDGLGTVAGVPYTQADDLFASVVRLDPENPSGGQIFLDGVELYDGVTRQLDAFSLPRADAAVPVPVLGPLGLGLLSAALCALGGIGVARRR